MYVIGLVIKFQALEIMDGVKVACAHFSSL